MSALSRFHPLIASWFLERFGRPTDVQERAWPLISQGRHALITAPTGSGKTLTAFLWALDRLITGALPEGRTSILYVSPLKALNNDLRRNLETPLIELKETFARAGTPFPTIRVMTRSGDTPQSERRRMLRCPPEILITTPESLNLLLGARSGRSILTTLNVVILDEVHAVVGTKRGVHLITAVDRLVPLSGEFQRLALSATIRPLDTVAEFVGGYVMTGGPDQPVYRPRPVQVVQSESTKSYDVRVRFPAEAAGLDGRDSIWKPLASELRQAVDRNRSTLIFVNSRRLSEKLTYKINLGEPAPLAYAHHGSLSREIREDVEARLKAGGLRAIVATNTLELGIDVGELDEVLLVQSPPSVSSAIQRVGRAGHQVGQVSQGTLFPTHDQDLLEAAVLARTILDQDIEAVRPVRNALDVLAQVIVSMVGLEDWDPDALYAAIRTSYPYRHLGRRQFDLVLGMLAGRYADSRVRELRPRLSIDRLDNRVSARKGALLALYTSGGVIPDRGYFNMRHQDSGGLIGELDEEFVWEARIGQIFTLGAQNWRIQRVTHSDVFVLPAHPKAMAAPFWKGEDNGRDFHLSERVGLFLERAEVGLDDPDFAAEIGRTYHLEPAALEKLLDYLKRQKQATSAPLPHRHHVLLEYIGRGPGGAPGRQIALHALWGGRVNRPWAMALDAAWETRFGHRPRIYPSNDCVVIVLESDVEPEDLLSLVTSANVEDLIRRRLEGSGFFGARFRECAGRALLLARGRPGQRMPLWMSRLRSQRLMAAVRRYEDFPILLEAWRSCLQDEFDLEGLRRVLTELESGGIRWSAIETASPSPMARASAWRQVNEYMYMGDESATDGPTSLSGDLLREVVFSPDLRPSIPPDIIDRFEGRRLRLSPGYAPADPADLLDWVKERLLIPWPEWKALLAAMRSDQGGQADRHLESISAKLVRLSGPAAEHPLVAALENASRLLSALGGPDAGWRFGTMAAPDAPLPVSLPEMETPEEDPDEALTWLLGEWLALYGPMDPAAIRSRLGLAPDRLDPALAGLTDSETIVSGLLVEGSRIETICDAENFEILLRMARKAAMPDFQPLDIDRLVPFLARHQGLSEGKDGPEALSGRLEQLLCLPLPARLWESEVLPARLPGYDPAWLDRLVQESDLGWIGHGPGLAAFCFETDLDLMNEDTPNEEGSAPEDEAAGKALFPDRMARYDFGSLVRVSGLPAEDLNDRLWTEVWNGRATNDTFAALRHGVEHRFRLPPGTAFARPGPGKRMGGPARTRRWKSRPFPPGNWFQPARTENGGAWIEIEERKKERVRLLLDRYGLVSRELLQKEALPFRWPALFRTLRLMELSGEVLAGSFFKGLAGPQFISHQAFHLLRGDWNDDRVYWFQAMDPVSPCGLGLEAFKGRLPRRVEGAHLVFRGPELVLVSERQAKSLTFHVAPDDTRLPEYLGPLRHLLDRRHPPRFRLRIETINGREASASPYLDALKTAFEVMIEHRTVILYRDSRPPSSNLSGK
ncbi:MAG: DEAD/DEAH box helicase [Proteobacteria bacterium]|nr:DEAD/DEAH box helicase [Pseudomonadota bacterium]